MTRPRTTPAAVLAARLPLILLSLLVLFACGESPAPSEPASMAARPSPAPADPMLSATDVDRARQSCLGVVVARKVVDVASDTNGILIDLPVQPGMTVDEGSMIARVANLDAEHARIIRELTVARRRRDVLIRELDRTLCELRQARTEYRCITDLSEREQASSPKEVRTARNQVELAGIAVDISYANLDQQNQVIHNLMDQLLPTVVCAPCAGSIATIYRESGAAVTQGAPIARLISVDDLAVRFCVPPGRARRDVEIGGVITAHIETPPGATAIGIIDRVFPDVDPVLGRVVEATIKPDPASGTRVRPGAVARVVVEQSTAPENDA